MKRNGYFQLIHKDNNIFLRGVPGVDGGEALQMQDILNYIDAKKYENVDLVRINEFVDKVNAQAQPDEYLLFGKDILPENEYLKITVEPNGLYAKGRFYAPSSQGNLLKKEDIIALLAQAGITYGIITKNLDIFCKARLYCTDIVLAKATKPIEGSDAEITYYFDVTKTRKPTLNEDGSVDFHRLDAIPRVEEGAVLATLKPADSGKAGTDVYGKPLPPKKVKHLKLKHGLNIHLSEDELTMYADVSGHATVANDQVFVSDTYEVPADVSTATGDIDYNGNVEVKGNVATGYKIQATGDIVVNGVVEGATLIAGGQIMIKRGVQGMGKGVLKSKGNIVSKFFENCEVTSGGDVTADAIMHSQVQASGKIIVAGKRGLITGGSLLAGNGIEAKTVGSTMGTATALEVGVDPEILEQYHAVADEIKENEENIEKTEKVLAFLIKKKKDGETLSEDKLQLLQVAKANNDAMKKKAEDLAARQDELNEIINEQKDGKIIVHNVAYTGVKLTISKATMFVKSETHHSTFVRDGADVRTRGI